METANNSVRAKPSGEQAPIGWRQTLFTREEKSRRTPVRILTCGVRPRSQPITMSAERSPRHLNSQESVLKSWRHRRRRCLYLVRAFVKHLPCPGELVGVGRVLHPHGARGARPALRQVSADRLLGHVVGQAGAARARRRRGASAVREEETLYFTQSPLP